MPSDKCQHKTRSYPIFLLVYKVTTNSLENWKITNNLQIKKTININRNAIQNEKSCLERACYRKHSDYMFHADYIHTEYEMQDFKQIVALQKA